MKEQIIAELKSARNLYITHHRSNHTQARGLCLLFWGEECKRLRAALEACDV